VLDLWYWVFGPAIDGQMWGQMLPATLVAGHNTERSCVAAGG